jgi:ferritin-like metal-binding protein YciE
LTAWPVSGARFFSREDDVGLFSKDIKTMDDLLLHGLQDIYYAEQQIIKALPKMIDQATNRDLAQGLKTHLEETNKQIERLDQVFNFGAAQLVKFSVVTDEVTSVQMRASRAA